VGYVDTDPHAARPRDSRDSTREGSVLRKAFRAAKEAWWEKIALQRLREEKLREDRSHAKLMEKLGYLPDQARTRIRRAQPPRNVGEQ
jgi:hypothetical protein